MQQNVLQCACTENMMYVMYLLRVGKFKEMYPAHGTVLIPAGL